MSWVFILRLVPHGWAVTDRTCWEPFRASFTELQPELPMTMAEGAEMAGGTFGEIVWLHTPVASQHNNNNTIFEVKTSPRWTTTIYVFFQKSSKNYSYYGLWSKMPLGSLQEPPKTLPRASKSHPRASQEAPKSPQEAPTSGVRCQI